MNNQEILKHVDHTQLKAFASREDIRKLCDEAMRLGTASVCVPPCYIRWIRENYPDLTICTVVGFPLGYSVTAAKEEETRQALSDGADEVDMVINITDVKNGNFDAVRSEIASLRLLSDGRRKDPPLSDRHGDRGGLYQNLHRFRYCRGFP